MCSLEFPDLETSFWQRYRDRGLQVFGVARILGVGGDTDAVVRQFVAQTGVTFPILRDPVGYPLFFDAAVGPALSPYPLDVVIDAEGRLVAVYNEYRPDALAADIEPLVR